MHLDDNFLFARDDCIQCPSQAPTCNCNPDTETCTITSRVCNACPEVRCDPINSGSGGGGGISAGAVAGGIVGAIILLSACLLLFLWYRRRLQREKAAVVQPDAKPDVPASAADVLSRPDPVEKPTTPTVGSRAESERLRMYSTTSDSTINLDPFAQYPTSGSGAAGSAGKRLSRQGSVVSNPFTDTQSIQTASDSTQSTNVIPIALVPHGSVASPPHSPTVSERRSQTSGNSATPSRPARSPQLNIRLDPLSSSLNLEHINVSSESFRPPNAPYAYSQRSGQSTMSSRASVMTSGSFASDILSEAPQIVTPNSGAVRQVLGVAKAEVILAPGSNPTTPLTADSRLTSASSRISRPPFRSPLAQSSFGPADTLAESDLEGEGQVLMIPSRKPYNPFGDEHSPLGGSSSAAASVSTFGSPSAFPAPPNGSFPPQHAGTSSTSGLSEHNGRPLSEATQAGSIIAADIGNAMLVRMDSKTSVHPSVRTMNRMTSGKLVSPSTAPLHAEDDRFLQDQQAKALAVARARVAASGLAHVNGNASPSLTRRTSAATVASVASAGGDSILESFTFVPPSPISSRPPRSPLAQQTFVQQQSQNRAAGEKTGDELEPPRPAFRHQQGFSTSSGSSELEGYTFHIDSGVNSPAASPAPSHGARDSGASGAAGSPAATGPRPHRQRASLDTLALTADLSAFPLNFDEGRDSFGPTK